MKGHVNNIPPLIWILLMIGLVLLFAQLLSSTSGTFEERAARVGSPVEQMVYQ
jgi:hypothetical protein